MTERLLQYIWQFQHYNKADLTTEQGDLLQVINQGQYNINQGPDFRQATIKLDDTTWVGNIEIHLKSSDWRKHHHSFDNNFSNIILHVVWLHDEDIKDINNILLPTLCLQNRVPKLLLDRYHSILNSQDFIPSQKHLPALSELGWSAWKERLAVERLQRKTSLVLSFLSEANNHWEEVFWWLLARNFGMKVNADVFENIARSLSMTVIGRHKNQIHQLEALLLGQANLLEEKFEEEYPQLLQREYRFYKKKYLLKQLTGKPFFLRMRPANFPTLRLAQLAMLIKQSTHLFSKVKETQTVEDVKELLNVTPNDYWHYHYIFNEATLFKPKVLGKQMIDNIIINTIVPVLFAYGSFTKDDQHKSKALKWLSQLAPESNSITNKWKSFGIRNDNALDSQALIELKNSYCNEKRCLECAVGNAILKKL